MTARKWIEPLTPAEALFKRLWKTPCPPDFELGCGWHRQVEDCGYIAMYWTPVGDELYITDGMYGQTSNHHCWLEYHRHHSVVYALAIDAQRHHIPSPGFTFGGSDNEPQWWLIMDRVARCFFAAKASGSKNGTSHIGTITRWLRSQFPPLPPENCERLSPSQVSAFVDAMRESFSASEVRKRMQEEYEHVKRIRSWLDSSPLTLEAISFLKRISDQRRR